MSPRGRQVHDEIMRSLSSLTLTSADVLRATSHEGLDAAEALRADELNRLALRYLTHMPLRDLAPELRHGLVALLKGLGIEVTDDLAIRDIGHMGSRTARHRVEEYLAGAVGPTAIRFAIAAVTVSLVAVAVLEPDIVNRLGVDPPALRIKAFGRRLFLHARFRRHNAAGRGPTFQATVRVSNGMTLHAAATLKGTDPQSGRPNIEVQVRDFEVSLLYDAGHGMGVGLTASHTPENGYGVGVRFRKRFGELDTLGPTLSIEASTSEADSRVVALFSIPFGAPRSRAEPRPRTTVEDGRDAYERGRAALLAADTLEALRDATDAIEDEFLALYPGHPYTALAGLELAEARVRVLDALAGQGPLDVALRQVVEEWIASLEQITAGLPFASPELAQARRMQAALRAHCEQLGAF